MKSLITAFIALLAVVSPTFCQTTSGSLKFKQGQELEVSMNLKSSIAQEAMGQSIDFNVDGVATHMYTVTNTTSYNSTLHHKMKRISYSFDGMGQKQSFDSDKQKDLDGQFGKPIKELLGKTYDMVIDPTGKVMMVVPEKLETSNPDPRIMMIMSMLTDLVSTVQPPQKNKASFFKVLPDGEISIGGNWSESENTESGKFTTNYTIASINDTTIVVEFTGTSNSTTKAEMMGMETSTTMNSKTKGNIILDRGTGIIRQKTNITDSNGSTEVMGTTLPVTSKITTVINVKPQN